MYTSRVWPQGAKNGRALQIGGGGGGGEGGGGGGGEGADCGGGGGGGNSSPGAGGARAAGRQARAPEGASRACVAPPGHTASGYESA